MQCLGNTTTFPSFGQPIRERLFRPERDNSVHANANALKKLICWVSCFDPTSKISDHTVIKAIQEIGLIIVSRVTELGTGSIPIRGKRGDGVKIIQGLRRTSNTKVGNDHPSVTQFFW